MRTKWWELEQPEARIREKQLTKTLGISDVVLRRRVERLRKRVASSFEKRLGLPIEADAVVQNQRWQGYRLNPMIRVVAFDQICHAAKPGCHDSER